LAGATKIDGKPLKGVNSREGKKFVKEEKSGYQSL
jgi:hypothetical protein